MREHMTNLAHFDLGVTHVPYACLSYNLLHHSSASTVPQLRELHLVTVDTPPAPAHLQFRQLGRALRLKSDLQQVVVPHSGRPTLSTMPEGVAELSVTKKNYLKTLLPLSSIKRSVPV